LNDDFLDLLSALLDADAKFMVVGAYAVGVHARPRATKDLDIWVEASVENSHKVVRALKVFGAPLHDLSDDDFARPGAGFMMGIPPRRIDILTQVSGVAFEEAWPNRFVAAVGANLRCPFIGLADLIQNKRAAARDQDLVDVTILERISRRPSST
jgi:hypothetical protein